MNKLLLSITLLLLAYNISAETLYRSIDENGKVQYSDVPLRNAADTEKLNSTQAPAADDTLPFELRRAVAKYPVTLYVAASCVDACAQARSYLNKRGIPFAEKSLASVDEIDAFKKSSGGDQIPAMQVGTNWIIGFSEGQFGQALDSAGYPKTAPYGFHPGAKSAPQVEKPKSE
jgi:glutaredoxin